MDKKDEFLASLLHDIKSPLLSIGIALENRLDDELLRDIYQINLSTLNFIENMLHIYTLGDTTWQTNLENTDVSRLLEEQLLRHKYLLKNKGLKINVSGFDSMPVVLLCPVSVGRVFSNLISNAQKFAPQDSEITICAKNLKNALKFEFTNHVHENGKKLTNKIFEKFHSDRKLNSQGLGLYICKKVLEKTGGDITVKNGNNKVTFCVRVKSLCVK